MDIRKLTAEDYDSLLNLLNTVFATKYGRDMDFLCEQPRMWKRDDEAMGKHTGVFEGGKLVSVVGVYPLPVKIGDEKLLFATTGNVATLPEYEGRGYFTKLFTLAMTEIEEMGVDAARLGGARQRYARYGFEPSGSSFRINLNSDNRVKFFKDRGANVVFEKIKRDSINALRYISSVINKKDFFVERGNADGYLDLYLLLGTKHSASYVAKRGDKMIGYLCATADAQYVGVSDFGRNITEYGYNSTEDMLDMLSAYQRKVGSEITLTVAPHETALLQALSSGAEYVSLVSPSRFKIMNYVKLTNALIKLKDKAEELPIGESVIAIEGYGRIKLYKNLFCQGAEMTEVEPDISLSPAEATRLLFGHLPAFATKKVPKSLKAFLPLPLSWNTLDYV